VATTIAKLAYKTLQQGKSIAGLAHKEISSKLMESFFPEAIPKSEPISKELFMKLRASIEELERLDWSDAEKGLYPKSQLFEAPWLNWARKYPLVWLDMPSTWQRRVGKKTRDIPKKVNKGKYPDYYLQNFHHQTDGYLSDYSASLYDLQVEILFNGTADSMRRRIISPLKEGLGKYKDRKPESIRILDLATGTGRSLTQIKSAFPKADLFGVDLSSSYLRQAATYLNTRNNDLVQLIRSNAEDMPLADSSMQAITCVFLFHELPPKARQNVLNECYRVLETGGCLVIADSIQINDSPEFLPIMDGFHQSFHEPYYKDYINDDIEKRLIESGFSFISAQSYFMTRVWSAVKD
tara:strand:- start:705 stop:1760 length:1056 start_codon:yes stop_codon:yes gene_type:complete